jgi:N-acetylmuramoyl-L-alanine amidase
MLYYRPLKDYLRRPTTTHIIVHAALTVSQHAVTAADIRRWHLANGWVDIGYHLVIRRDGTLEVGRPVWATGAHTVGRNSDSVGICLAGGGVWNEKTQRMVWAPDGEDNFTPEQMRTLMGTVQMLRALYPTAAIDGHRDHLPKGDPKRCPAFDVRAWAARNKL